MPDMTDVRVSPIPLYECDIKVGDRVRSADPDGGGYGPDEDLYVLGVEWRHQRDRADSGWNITIASADDIAKGYGATDGYRPEHLIPVRAAIEPAPKPAGGEWVTLPVLATEEMIEAGRSALREHTDVYMDGGMVVLSGAVEAIYLAMQEDAPTPPSADSAQDVGELVEALEWYAEQTRLCRLIHSEGDSGRYALSADGGKRARDMVARFKRSTTDGKS